MKLGRGVALGLIVLACAGGSYLATYAWQAEQLVRPTTLPVPSDVGLAGWLRLDPPRAQSVSELEKSYRAERGELEKALSAEREALARLFEDTTVTSDAILAQVERVIAASAALERRTADFLLAVRMHLDSTQAQRLLKRFAAGIREGGGHRWRRGQSAGDDESQPRGGPPERRGPGRGRGGPPWDDRRGP